MKKKSILEQALLQVETLEEAVKQNAKGILASTFKQGLNELLKEESSNEEEEVEPQEQLDPDMEDETSPETDEENPTEDETTDTEDETESPVEDEEPESGPVDDVNSLDNFNEPSTDDDIDSTEADDDFESEDESDDDMLDLTGASDDEVLKVFKAMKPEDGIVVKKEGNKLELEDGENDYIIKLNESEYGFGDDDEFYDPNDPQDDGLDDEEDDRSFEEILRSSKRIPKNLRPKLDQEDEPELSPSEDEELPLGEEDETIYEIELDGEDDTDYAPEGEFSEAARTKWNPHGDKNGMDRAGLKSKKVFKAGSGQSVNEEVDTLKKTIEVLTEQNGEYKKALSLFKEKLNEVAVFNANLAYSTRLFTENTTTKQEKLNILKRFDSVSTLNESKTLYSTIKSELESKKPVSESLSEKISTTPKSSTSSQSVLSESKAYVNPDITRIKDLMKKMVN